MMTRTTVCLLVGLALGACDLNSPLQIPEFDTTAAEPQVAERLAALREQVVAHPDSAPAWGLFALSLQAHGFPDAAVESYAAARSLRPGTFAYLYLPATLLADQGSPDADRLFEQARVVRPNYVPLRLRLASWELDLGRPDRAIALIGDSLVISASPARARLILARAALARGELDRARTLLDVVIQTAPRYAQAYALSAEVYRRSGEVERADLDEQRSRVFKQEPRLEDPVLATLFGEGISSRWHLLRGQGYLVAGQADDARAAFELAVAARPDYANGWNQLGLAMNAMGRFDEASSAYQRAIDLRPQFANAFTNLAMSLFSNGEFEAGVNAATQAIQNDSTAAQAYLYLGVFEQALGRTDKARDIFSTGLSMAPFDASMGIRLSWLLATSPSSSSRDGPRAVELAETVNQIEGFSQAVSLDALAAAYAETGAFDQAMAAATRASRIALQQADTALAAGMQQRARLYSQGRPYRQ